MVVMVDMDVFVSWSLAATTVGKWSNELSYIRCEEDMYHHQNFGDLFFCI